MVLVVEIDKIFKSEIILNKVMNFSLKDFIVIYEGVGWNEWRFEDWKHANNGEWFEAWLVTQ